ncbi:hypothetical protein K457DRAFT_347874 [Linnemannia elongata AG-77]|uniref:Uncharacterized protein n=1 Tax=Linnemannia elongata AG-77 TaxID=1314771 RepID=A0A197K4N5_9FUNG|nr:hypothetical protein K457DRAFT_347874 [Linnemannia elongata AG-77]
MWCCTPRQEGDMANITYQTAALFTIVRCDKNYYYYNNNNYSNKQQPPLVCLSVCLSVCLYVCLFVSSPLFLHSLTHTLSTLNGKGTKTPTLLFLPYHRPFSFTSVLTYLFTKQPKLCSDAKERATEWKKDRTGQDRTGQGRTHVP